MMRLLRKFHLILVVLSCSAAGMCGLSRQSLADVIAIHPSQDVSLFGGGDATGNNTSSGPGMFVGTDGTSAKRGIVQFNVAGAIPAGATITSATLTLYLGMWAGSGGSSNPSTGDTTVNRTIRLFDVTTAWHSSVNGTTGFTSTSNPFGGAGHGFAPNAGDATWNYASYNTSGWFTPGGDFSATESADTQVSKNFQTGYNWTDPRMVQDVQNWLEGSLANDGWLLMNDAETGSQGFRAFYTQEGAIEKGQPQFKPTLTVTYTPIPEPASLGLLALGSVAVLVCNKKRTA